MTNVVATVAVQLTNNCMDIIKNQYGIHSNFQMAKFLKMSGFQTFRKIIFENQAS